MYHYFYNSPICWLSQRKPAITWGFREYALIRILFTDAPVAFFWPRLFFAFPFFYTLSFVLRVLVCSTPLFYAFILCRLHVIAHRNAYVFFFYLAQHICLLINIGCLSYLEICLLLILVPFNFTTFSQR